MSAFDKELGLAKIEVIIEHSLSEAEALKRIKNLLAEVKEQLGDKVSRMNEKWDGSTGTFDFTALGFAITGTLTVTPTQVIVDSTLPWAAYFLKNRIEEEIKKRAGILLQTN